MSASLYDPSLAIPPLPRRAFRPAAAVAPMPGDWIAALREACQFGTLALALAWGAAELALAMATP
jgi:hypothetical protein